MERKQEFSWSRCPIEHVLCMSHATAVLKIESVYKYNKNYYPKYLKDKSVAC